MFIRGPFALFVRSSIHLSITEISFFRQRKLNHENKSVHSENDSPMKAKGGANDFPVVCVGGSAGGLDAYIRLLRNLPADLGVAVVIVNHLRTVATRLHEILPSYTTMPVELITEKLLIQPNHVFILTFRTFETRYRATLSL
jgi:chemotaxis response regulator CheB